MKALLVFFALAVPVRAADMTWQVRIQYIEACSCDLFCPCYFNDHASHQGSGEHKCNFNNAGRILKGKYGDVDLAGLKFWLSGDLGADWATKGQADWLVATFEPKATKEQKDAVMAAFNNPLDAVAAAIAIRDGCAATPAAEGDPESVTVCMGKVYLYTDDACDQRKSMYSNQASPHIAGWTRPMRQPSPAPVT